MKREISLKAMEIIKKMQQNELTESVIYSEIAKFAKGEENKNTLRRLSEEEKAHYEIWKRYTGIEMKPEKAKIFKYKGDTLHHEIRIQQIFLDNHSGRRKKLLSCGKRSWRLQQHESDGWFNQR